MGTLEGSIQLKGDFIAKTLSAQGGKHSDDKFDANGFRKAEYTVHERLLTHYVSASFNPTAGSHIIGTFFADATLVEVAVICEAPPDTATGSSGRFLTADFLKGSESAAFASILPGGTPVQVDSTLAAKEVQYAVPTTTTAARGDQIKLTLAVGGSAGTHPLGLTFVLKYRENPT